MAEVAYDGLADVYDWLVPDALLTPEGTVAAFRGLISLPPAAACSTPPAASANWP